MAPAATQIISLRLLLATAAGWMEFREQLLKLLPLIMRGIGLRVKGVPQNQEILHCLRIRHAILEE